VPSEEAGRVLVRRALFSVDDKSGVTDLARRFARWSAEIVATTSTRAALRADGIESRAAEELTGIGSWFGGRVKTLHPGILGGVLAPRTPEGERELAERNLLPIDAVVVNLYPFVQHERDQPGAPDREEYIDIGGVTLARAAAKNHAAVLVVSDPADYREVAEALDAGQGSTGPDLRAELARRTFQRTARYDFAIASALSREPSSVFPAELHFVRDTLDLRYGENPHQPAAVYRSEEPRAWTPRLEVVKGPALSYTNLLDIDTALAIVGEFPTTTAALVKHATPCGVASGATLREALSHAVETDPVARYGCVIGVNRPFTKADAGALHGVFVDLLVAPEVTPDGRAALEHRPKVKVVVAPSPDLTTDRWEYHDAMGRLLVQAADRRQLEVAEYRQVTQKAATPTEACALDFAWRVVRHAKSNAVVLAQGSKTVGIGSGQTSRVKAVDLAVEVAGDRARGSVLASDAFFPFADGVEAAGRAGVAAIIQPGGSIRDAEVVAAADKFGIAMYCTGWRVFRH
jgi:phosphoribosylaminoimidazolecarboxamide formyltransferase/IMP cyclohydrolase